MLHEAEITSLNLPLLFPSPYGDMSKKEKRKKYKGLATSKEVFGQSL
jgi:hypothetical protein